jgi:RHS repeat-associated protein
VHTDNLSGTSVVTDSSGGVAEAQDFYPYGGIRIDSRTNYGGEKRKYAGTEYDSLSGLNYAMARYENPTHGQFASEDPVFLAIGNPDQIRSFTQQDQQQLLMDPQQMNSYSYARGNPITKSDPQGLAPGPNPNPSLFSSNLPLATLELYGYVSTLADANAYFSGGPKSPTTQNKQKAQLQFDLATGAAGVFATTPQGVALTVGGVILQGVDAYCGGHTCRDFSAAANTTPAAVLSSLRPAPGVVPSPYNLNSSGGTSRSMPQGGASIASSPGGAQFISNLKSFATALQAYVATLSSNSGTRGSNSSTKQ